MNPAPLISAARKLPRPADSCGCAMGARFLGLGFAGSTVWYLAHWHAFSIAGICGRVLAISFASAIIGKLIGLGLWRLTAASSRPAALRRLKAHNRHAAFNPESPLS
jgi:hypothetical protein